MTFMGLQTGEMAAHHPARMDSGATWVLAGSDWLQCHTSTSGELELAGQKGRVITSSNIHVGCLKSTVVSSEMLGRLSLMD